MIAGWDRYFQIVKCFRDEDLRADRQPEFTQIDCEMSFVRQEDVIEMAEGMVKKAFKELKGIDWSEPFPRMTWADAMDYYGSDKPDLRFGMKFVDITDLAQTKDFKVFNEAKYVAGICVKGCASYSRKELDGLTEFVKRPQVGAKGLVYVKMNEDGTIKSSVDKFYSEEDLRAWAKRFGAEPGDLLLILCGDKRKTQVSLGQLRLKMGDRLGLRDRFNYAPLWVVDFPMFEWDEESGRYKAMHHPFTMPRDEDVEFLESDPGRVCAYAYDMVLNGVEMGGGSVRIHDRSLQNRVFKAIGLTQEDAEKKFGYLLDAFKYGAPPHAGLAFGLDRFVALLAGLDSIRDCIAFPKNNKGRDVMIEAPSKIDDEQLKELNIAIVENKE
jgi:aspartyl-tRNA synthetase